MSELPEGWEDVPFDAIITELRNGISTKPNLNPPGTPILRISAVRPGKVLLDDRRYLSAEQSLGDTYRLENGDLLFTRYNGSLELLGVCGMVRELRADEKLLYPDKLMRVRLDCSVVEPEFVERFFQCRAAREALMAEARSSAGQQGVSGADLKRQRVVVAPVAEQRRIVAKVEALLDQVNRAQARLNRVPLILKRFRQAVLAAACAGNLTEEWRQRRKGNPANPSFARMSCDENAPSDLPESWAWVRFSDVIAELRNGVSPRPELSPPGIPILRISAARAGAVDLMDRRYLRDGKRFVDRFSLRDGDLLFTRYNGSLELLGVCGLVRGLGDTTLLYPDKLMRVRLNHAAVVAEYLEIFFSSPSARERMIENAKSSAGQQGVSGEDVKRQWIAVPPRAEQEEIVRCVRALLHCADRIEQRLSVANARAAKLPQAILSKAFSGELVPTEAELARTEGREYETAEQLLERIKGSDAATTNGRHARKRLKALAARPAGRKARQTVHLAAEDQ